MLSRLARLVAVALQMGAGSFYNHANICSDTKPSSTHSKLTYGTQLSSLPTALTASPVAKIVMISKSYVVDTF